MCFLFCFFFSQCGYFRFLAKYKSWWPRNQPHSCRHCKTSSSLLCFSYLSCSLSFFFFFLTKRTEWCFYRFFLLCPSLRPTSELLFGVCGTKLTETLSRQEDLNTRVKEGRAKREGRKKSALHCFAFWSY